MREIGLGLLIVAGLSSIVYAQKQTRLSKATIDVAGINLQLGMTKAQVEEKLGGREITKIQQDEWMVGSEKQLGPTLQFRNGLLNFADRYWSTTDNDIAEALFGAVTSLNQEGFSDCTIEAGVNASPDMTAHNIWIRCGEKGILITRHLMGAKSYNMVYEQLGVMHPWSK